MTLPRHVLVADDEPHIGRIIKMKLEQGPFRVTLAFDGREALDILQREDDIALVLLDVMMPRVSGFDVLSHMRSTEHWRLTPCIVLTAAGQDAQHQRAVTDWMYRFGSGHTESIRGHRKSIVNELRVERVCMRFCS